ncbi:MAG: helix-hairpin-helix domain-containing protein [Caldilineales bacterium]
MELLGALIGIGVLAAAPGVPVLRGVAKLVVKNGMAVADATAVVVEATVATAAVVGRQVSEMTGHLHPHDASETVGDGEAAATVPESADVGDVPPAAVEPARGAEAVGPVRDDLIIIKGVGPKTVVLLHNAGINTFVKLAETPVEQLQAILDQAGRRYRSVDPRSWPEQALAQMYAPIDEAKGFDDANLLQIDGIGPKISALLREAGIGAVSVVAKTPVERLQKILGAAGPRYRGADPATWPAQARDLLAEAGQA